MKEINRHILQRAIRDLPGFRINKDIWPNIKKDTINLSFRENLNKLPEFKAPDRIWEKVQFDLEPDSFKNAKINLPEFKAPDRIWNNIEPHAKDPVVQRLKILYKYAAAFILLVGLTVGVLFKSSESDISYSIEIVPIETNIYPGEKRTDITQKLCHQNPVACRNLEYIELNKQLNEVSLELEKLHQMVEKIKSPLSQKYIYMLENKRVEIEKKMIKVVLDS